MPIRDWRTITNQLISKFGDRYGVLYNRRHSIYLHKNPQRFRNEGQTAQHRLNTMTSSLIWASIFAAFPVWQTASLKEGKEQSSVAAFSFILAHSARISIPQNNIYSDGKRMRTIQNIYCNFRLVKITYL